jgi:hypothetical protein
MNDGIAASQAASTTNATSSMWPDKKATTRSSFMSTRYEGLIEDIAAEANPEPGLFPDSARSNSSLTLR